MLRKNYTSLRDAAKVLQIAWREKKKFHITTHHTEINKIGINTDIVKLSSDKVSNNDSPHSSIDVKYSYNDGMERKLQAAATLQAHTRGMIARKSFASIRKQTMATIIIQKNLVKWYATNREIHLKSIK